MIAIASEPATLKGGKSIFTTAFKSLPAFFFVLMLVLPATFQLKRGLLLAGLLVMGSDCCK